jgi:hypothetical protein
VIFSSGSRLFLYVVLCFSLFQAGCATRLPFSVPASDKVRDEIIARYLTSGQEICSTPIDADISLEMESFGKHLRASGMLQIQPPSLLRVTILDQVDRPLFILVAKGESLTLVNSMKGEALVGSVREFIRAGNESLNLGIEEIILLLTGRYYPPPSCIMDVRLDQESGKSVWLVFPAAEEKRLNIVFDPGTGRIMRHVFTDGMGNILLDIGYRWKKDTDENCVLPAELSVGGEVVEGKITLEYDRILSEPVLPESTFQLTLPEHYIIREMK